MTMTSPVQAQNVDAERFAERLERTFAELQPRLPDVDPDDLVSILHAALRPVGSGRRFILRRSGSGYVF